MARSAGLGSATPEAPFGLVVLDPPYDRPADLRAALEALGSTAADRLDVDALVPLPFPYEDWKDADIPTLSDEQKEALLAGDFLQLLRLGANVYFLAKIAIPRGVSVQDAGAQFQGITTEEFKENLLKRAEGFQDRLEEEGGFWNG